MVEPLRMPDFSHVAIYRNEYGSVTHRELLLLPLASDDDVLMAARGRNRVDDEYCDVFEVGGFHRCGGWKFHTRVSARA